MTFQKFLAVIATLVAAGCATAPPPAPAPSAQEEHLIDPRTGWHGEKPDAIEHRFETAWRFFLAGDNATARQRLEDIRNRDAQYAPAALAEAAIDIREGHLDSARHAVDRIAEQYPNYVAAEVYEAEIDIAQNQIRSAYERYRTLIGRPDAPWKRNVPCCGLWGAAAGCRSAFTLGFSKTRSTSGEPCYRPTANGDWRQRERPLWRRASS